MGSDPGPATRELYERGFADANLWETPGWLAKRVGWSSSGGISTLVACGSCSSLHRREICGVMLWFVPEVEHWKATARRR